jgi:type II restriction enzyme
VTALELQMDFSLAARFSSASQQARVMTEAWAQENLYCVNCESEHLCAAPPNTQVVDFTCRGCAELFQLKSQSAPLGRRVADSGYDAMCRAIRSNQIPNLILLHYDRAKWRVEDVMLIPSFGFSLAAVEKRKPLGPTARRAGWVGCNILLSNIPGDLRLPLVVSSQVAESFLARKQYRTMSALRSLSASSRGWLVDVLNVARSLNKQEFRLSELYAQDQRLGALHPQNLHVRPKIRQQLQRLRDMGLLSFAGDGVYRWSAPREDYAPIGTSGKQSGCSHSKPV